MIRSNKSQHKIDTIIRNISSFYSIFITRFRAVVAIVICSFLAVFLNSYNARNIKSYADDIAQILYTKISVPVYWLKSKVNVLENYSDIIEENEALKQLNIENIDKFALIAKLELENQQLKSILNYTGNIATRYVTTRIVSAATDEFGTTMMINVGANDSIAEGYPILNELGIIGRIISVSDNAARVLLLTNNSSKIPIRLFYSKISCIAIGIQEDNLLRILYIEPSNNHIMENDLVFTSGDGYILPYGLYVGKVIKKDDEFFIKPVIDYNDIEIVKVLIPEVHVPVAQQDRASDS